MHRCGEEPKLYGQVDRHDLTRKYARIDMYCSCRTHSISKRRHTRVLRGEIRIICNHCHEILQATPTGIFNGTS
jgi:predicted SprT family Zn-dependent metalloprotease